MEHSHEHLHGHTHEHTHEHAAGAGVDRTRTLLGYMIDHNEHHCEEVADLLDALDGAPRKKLLEAIGSFEVANVQLRETLDLME